jgi:plasmid maintenance system antidote protein VapI
MHNPPHPGGILKEALESIPMSVTAFARHIGFTPEMSLKISEAFGQGQGDIWFLMQNDHDFWKASRAKRRKVPALKAHTLKIAA